MLVVKEVMNASRRSNTLRKQVKFQRAQDSDICPGSCRNGDIPAIIHLHAWVVSSRSINGEKNYTSYATHRLSISIAGTNNTS